MWANYHTHSKYCDGKGELADYIASARKNQVKSLGFSSHAPVPFPCKWCMDKNNLPLYLKEIDDLKNANSDIEIYKSLEIDFIPGIITPHEFRDELDYTIGSIHFVDQFADGTRWEIDNTHTVFKEGLDKIFKNNIKDAVCRYFELTREMLYGTTINILGHLDKIKMQSDNGKLFSEKDTWYQDEIKKTIKLIAQTDTIVEVNTRGLYQKKTTETYPSSWILELVKAQNIPITISSDAHHPDDLINQFTETATMLSKLGFKELSILYQGVWVRTPFGGSGF
jgi:histidinol-phosphatase (PHP family)